MARILIFSDDTEVFELLGFLLEREGHRVRVMRAMDARLERVKSFGPDLVMIDAASREDGSFFRRMSYIDDGTLFDVSGYRKFCTSMMSLLSASSCV